MMAKVRDALMIALLALGCALLAFLIVTVEDLRDWMQANAPDFQRTLAHVEATTATAEAIANDARPIVHKTLLHADRAVGEAAAAMASVAQTSRDVRDEQREISNASLLVLGETAATVKSVNDQVQTIGEQARYTLSGVESISKSATRTMDDLDKVILDPNVQATISDIHGASTQFAGTMTEVHGTATDFHGYIHRLTAPMGFWKSFGKHALGIGEKVGANAIVP